MELLLAAVAGVFLSMTLVLPLVTAGRTMRLTRRIDELVRRIDDVDRRLREATATATTAHPAAPAVAALETPPAEASAAEAASIAPPPPALEERAVPVAAPPVAAPRQQTLEERIGARWLLYAAIAALVVGTGYFVKFTFEAGWVTPVIRVAIGAVAGLALCEAGRRFVARGYAFYGHVLSGGGVVLLYVAAFAAFRFYALVSPAVAFGSFVAITAMAAAMADAQRAQPLALLALIGGFVTPFLVGGNRNAHVALFTYDATLIAGTLVVARRHAWPMLPVVALGLTGLSVLVWLLGGYTSGRWLSTELFLTLFCAMFLYAWDRARRLDTVAGSISALALALAPLAYHVASIAILASHSLPLLVYLIAITAAGVIAAEVLERPWLRLVVLAAVFLPLLAWADVRRSDAWLMPGAVTIAAVYGLHLITSLRAIEEDGPRLRDLEVVLLHANGLGLYVLLDPLLADRGLVTSGWLAAALGSWNLGLTVLSRRWSAEAVYHHLALAFAFAAAAIALETSGPWTAAGWAAEGAALVWIGLRAGRGWLRVGGLLLFALALLRLADALLIPAPVGQAALFNSRAGVALFAIALAYLTAWFHVRARDGRPTRWALEVGALVIAANLATLMWITAEIGTWFRPQAAAGPSSAVLFARQVATSIAWALYGVALVAVGIRRRYAPVRYIAIALLLVTIAKVFFVDLDRLDKASRILSTLGLGLALLVASYLYQRFQADAARPPSSSGPAPQDGHSP